MKRLLLVLSILMLATSPVLAGKNANGAMVVHTDDDYSWTSGVCGSFDTWMPHNWCVCLNTRTDKDENTPALIWFVAYFMGSTNPGVSIVYFGHDHNLPEGSHVHYGFCGPTGSLEMPDAGWPDAPATAGNMVAFGTPIVGDRMIPFYYVDVYGFEGAYYCTGSHPGGGYAAFVDDSNPPISDHCEYFGCVRWYEYSYNDCPLGEGSGACCLPDGTCQEWGLDMCMMEGGEWIGYCLTCDPDPCVNSSVSEIAVETVTWGRVKTTYRE